MIAGYTKERLHELPPFVQAWFRNKIDCTVDEEGHVCDFMDPWSDEEEYDDNSVLIELVPEGYKINCPRCGIESIFAWNPSESSCQCKKCYQDFYIQKFIFYDGVGISGMESLNKFYV